MNVLVSWHCFANVLVFYFGIDVHTKQSTQTEDMLPTSFSAKKLKTKQKDHQTPLEKGSVSSSHYIVIDVLQQILGIVAHCPECKHDTVEVQNMLSSKMVWANKLILIYHSCNWEKTVFTSKEVDSKHSGQKRFEPTLCHGFSRNRWRTPIYKKVLKYYEYVVPVTIKAYNNINSALSEAYLSACQKSMTNAADEVKQLHCVFRWQLAEKRP